MLTIVLVALAAVCLIAVSLSAVRVLRAARALRRALQATGPERAELLARVEQARGRVARAQQTSAAHRAGLDAELSDLRRTLGVVQILLQAAGDGIAPARAARHFLRGR